ncbi:MAG: sirohydrochlorin cobaltochelatase [Oscillospiraceae bacterium]|nr:sirohydrochlorin cobaltochelatase [Oscillospiraceae bacterium]
MKKALLAVSFGTGVPEARKDITAFEDALKDTAPDRAFFRAFTSPTIRRKLAHRGETVLSTEEALGLLAEKGYTDVAVQPGYILCGGEYDRLAQAAAKFAPRFERLRLGKPLLASDADLRTVAEVLWQTYRPEEGALALFGHGAAHLANMAYPAMQTALRLLGAKDAFVATVEGWPGYGELAEQLREGGYRTVTLTPLMLVAGDHALKDMAGDGAESWRSRLMAEGFTVTCRLQGLGAVPAIREIYAAHLNAVL